MSKQYESKKHAVSMINKTYPDMVNTDMPRRMSYETLESRYNTLLERTKKLEKVYQFHKGIVQNISSGLITIDLEGSITFINSAALQVVEFTFEDLVNRPVVNLFHDPDEGREIINELLKNRVMYESKELNLRSRTSKIIPIGFSTTLLPGENDRPDGVIISFRDLTQIRNFRIQMERMDRLATLGEVSAGIAHEIRNPLAGIKTSAQVLEESFGPGDFRSELISRIVKEIDRSNELLKSFFKFAKPGKPKQEFVDIHTIIDGITLLLKAKMRRHNISLNKNYEENLPLVYLDDHQIEQVIINIIINAMDATEKGGSINIETMRVSRKSEAEKVIEKTMVLVKVSDTGCGISKENSEKIFNPFFTTKSDGVGLGLSISSRLLEENNCQVEIDSEHGNGTTFKIYMPVG